MHQYEAKMAFVQSWQTFGFAHVRFLVGFLLVCLLCSLTGCGLTDEKCVLDTGALPERARQIAQTAREQIGVPYRPGGTTPKGFDCSGLVLYCYGKHGLALPRSASNQAEYGCRVCDGDLREGDILVFTPGFFSKHTGIYVGQGEFVHAPGRGRRVELCRLDAEHWQSMFSCARRFQP